MQLPMMSSSTISSKSECVQIWVVYGVGQAWMGLFRDCAYAKAPSEAAESMAVDAVREPVGFDTLEPYRLRHCADCSAFLLTDPAAAA